MTDHLYLRPWRALWVATILGLFCLGSSLIPGRSLLPRDVRTYEPYRESVEPELLYKLDHEAVPHRDSRLLNQLPLDVAVGESWSKGHVPLWHPGILCGTPLLGQDNARAFYPTALLFSFVRPEAAYAWLYLLHLVLGGLFAYRLARRVGASEEGGLLANGSFVLSGYALAHMHQPGTFFAAIWCFPALEIVWLLIRGSKIGETRSGRSCAGLTALLALVTALSWFAGQMQVTRLLIYMVLGYSTLLALDGKFSGRGWPWTGILSSAAGLLLGTGMALCHILPVLSSIDSARIVAGVDLSPALPPMPVAQLLDFVLAGQLTSPGDLVPAGPKAPRVAFGALLLLDSEALDQVTAGSLQFTHTNFAIGLGIWPLIMALSSLVQILFGAVSREGRLLRLFLWLCVVFGLLAAMGLNPASWITSHLPGLAEKDPKAHLLFPALALPILAGLGFRRLPGLVHFLALLLGIAAIAFGVYVLLLGPKAIGVYFSEQIAPRLDIRSHDFRERSAAGENWFNQILIGAGFVLAGVSLAVGGLYARFRALGAYALLLATSVQMLPLASYMSPAPTVDVVREPPPMFPAGVARPDESRVRPRILTLETKRLDKEGRSQSLDPLLPPNLATLQGMSHCGGRLRETPLRPRAFFSALDPANARMEADDLMSVDALDSPFLELMAPRFLLSYQPMDRAEWEEVASQNKAHLYESRTVLPRVRLYQEYVRVSLPDQFTWIREKRIDPSTHLMLEEEPGTKPAPVQRKGRTWISHYAPGCIRVRVQTAAPSLLFLSESYDKGWRYRLDGGRPLSPMPADIMFMAVSVPAGEHEITFEFLPVSFLLGSWLSASSLLLLALWGILLCRRGWGCRE